MRYALNLSLLPIVYTAVRRREHVVAVLVRLRRRRGALGAVRDRGRRRRRRARRAHQRRRGHRQRAREPARHGDVPRRRPAAGAAAARRPCARCAAAAVGICLDRAVPHAVARRPRRAGRRAARRRVRRRAAARRRGGADRSPSGSRPSATSRSRRPRRRASASPRSAAAPGAPTSGPSRGGWSTTIRCAASASATSRRRRSTTCSQPGAILRDEFIVDRPQVAHNTYLHVLAELGVPGLVLFGALLVAGLLAAWRAAREFARRGDPFMETCARAVVLALDRAARRRLLRLRPAQQGAVAAARARPGAAGDRTQRAG